jgi:hypothetical protein
MMTQNKMAGVFCTSAQGRQTVTTVNSMYRELFRDELSIVLVRVLQRTGRD